MRLICPRCGAQYEVDDSVIPAAGRDVQCSGCGQTWFQPSRQMLDAAQEKARADEDGLAQWHVSGAAAAGASETEAVAEARDWPEPQPEDWPDLEPPAAEPAPDTEPPELGVEDEIIYWSAPPVLPDLATTEPEPADPAPDDVPPADAEPDVSQAIAELIRTHPLSLPEEAGDAGDAGDAAPSAADPAPDPGEAAPLPPGMLDISPAPRVGAIPRRPLDENLMAILREEAEREAAARRAEGTGIETQEEMNLDPVLPSPMAPPAAPPPQPRPHPQSPPSAAPAQPVQPRHLTTAARAEPPRRVPDFSDLNSEDESDRHVDLTEGPAPDLEPAATGGRFTRRRRLPDIDEINSSLRASADREGDIAAMGVFPGRQKNRSGFRFGFSSVLLIAAIAALVYAYAPMLRELLPALAPFLDSYVAAVDAGRLWLDAQLRAVIADVQAGAPPQG